MKIRTIQRVGDRDKICWSIKEIAFTIVANPMSDRTQLVIEIDENLYAQKRTDGGGKGQA